jgi:signal transduction histidine kinase
MNRRDLASLGLAAAEVAHEGNNVLITMGLNLATLRNAADGYQKILTLVDKLEAGESRLRRLFETVRREVTGIHPNMKSANLRRIWRTAYRSAVNTYSKVPIQLRENVTTSTEHVFDPELMEGVFRNLFENAAAVSPTGVTVRVSCREVVVGGRPIIRIVVRDNGPGLPAADRARVFVPFFTTRPGGCGLGLGIARRIVNAHGGQLTVIDRDGPGAAFVIRLPRLLKSASNGQAR